MLRKAGLLLAVLAVAGCYHATVETGREASTTVIKQSFAASWIYGLVPPKTINAAAQCPNGVARVETQLSFVNQLVGVLTFGIYTPMTIEVTCATAGAIGEIEGTADIIIAASSSDAEIQSAMTEAAVKSAELGRPIFVKFQQDVSTPEMSDSDSEI